MHLVPKILVSKLNVCLDVDDIPLLEISVMDGLRLEVRSPL